MTSDTIYALSSGALPAAIAIVRVSGPAAEQAAERLAGSLPPPRQASLRRLIGSSGEVIDEVLLLHFPGPYTATGEPVIEFHLHGGRAVVARLPAELAVIEGLREAEPGEFTRRAVPNGRLDLTQAEGLADLLSAETEWQRRAAMESAGGKLRQEIEGWRRRLIDLSARAEAAIDYVGDEDETAIDLGTLIAETNALREEWEKRANNPPAELLQNGLRVVLAGPPNSGKSSLFNALLGAEKAIVTAIPGTTRDLVEARFDLDGIPITLVDTAGLRPTTDEVERIGVGRAERALAEADLLLWLGDPADVPRRPDTMLVHARADARAEAPRGSVPVSVRVAGGVTQFRTALREYAANLLPPLEVAALNRRQMSALVSATQALRGPSTSDIVIIADSLRQALTCLDRLSGVQGSEEMLDALFGRFCLGK